MSEQPPHKPMVGGAIGAIPGIVPIGAGRTDAQIAADIRADLHGRLEAISEIMTKAKREHGLTINFGFTPPDSFGRVSLAVLEISKKLC